MNKYLVLAFLIAMSSCFQIFGPFQPKKAAPQYSEDRSKFLIDLAAVSQCHAKQINEWSCALCKKHPNLQNLTHIEDVPASIVGFVAYDRDANQILLAWRGTADLRNWVEDFNFETVEYSACKGCVIHSGFYESYRSVSRKVNEAVDKLIAAYPSCTIASTGHSLGGALAAVCGLEMFKNYGQRMKEIHNFGAPRIGNAALAHYVHQKIPITFRIVHNRDLIPHLPPTEFKYLQYPYEVLYDEKMDNYQVCNESGEDRDCSDRFAPDYTMTDHGFYFLPPTTKVC